MLLALAALQLTTLPAEILTAAHFSPRYSWVGNTISDLGARTCTEIPYPHGPVAVCSPWHAVMNGSMILAGAAIVLLVALGRDRPGLRGGAGVLWVIGGVSTVLTGLVPLDVDLSVHVLVSLPVFLAFPVAIALSGRRLCGMWGWLGLAVGLVSLCAGLLLTLWTGASPWGGLLERIALWPAMVWMLVLVLRRP